LLQFPKYQSKEEDSEKFKNNFCSAFFFLGNETFSTDKKYKNNLIF